MKIAIVCDFVYPYSNDPTAKMASSMINYLNKTEEVFFFSRSLSKKTLNYYPNNVSEFLFRQFSAFTTSSFLDIIKKYNFFRKIIISFLFVFVWFFVKMHIIRFYNNSKYVSFIRSYVAKSNFDCVLLFCGNYSLLEIFNKNNLSKQINILFATDPWEKCFKHNADFEKKICDTFDYIYGFPGIEFKNSEFRKKISVCRYFVYQKINETFFENKNKHCGIYIGNVGETRSIDFLVDIFSEHADSFDFVFYSKENIIKNNFIHFRPPIYGNKLIEEIKCFDFIFAIDNIEEYKSWIPSKIYESLSFSKIFVFFTNDIHSPSSLEVKKCDYAFVYDITNKKSYIDFIAFLHKFDNKKISFKITDYYENCSVKQVAENVLSQINNYIK